MRLADLYGKPIHDADGARLGVVHEVRARDGQVEALDYGAGSLIERFSGKRGGGRVRWDQVRSVTAKRILIDLR
jgi:sporulation protein YlmC with PRC-barrel domain